MKRKKVVPIILIFFFAIVSIFFPYDLLFSLTNDMFVTHEELDDILKNDWLISSHVVSVSAKDDNDFDKYIINYKLFNLFNIKKLKVNVVDPDRYFAGGETLGFSLQSKGVILIGGNYILSKNGIERPFENSGLKTGDIITKIDGIEINNVEDISKILKNFEGGSVSLTVTRSGETFEVEISPALDSMTNTYKLGLWVKEDAVGIGTLSFVNATTKRFGSLGHSINDSETNECIKVSGGNIYESKILGIKKGKSGKAGELIGTFNRENVIGTVDKNCEYGVYGFVDSVETITKNKTAVDIGGRLSAKPGKAQILTCLDGDEIKAYDIEIIKTNFQSACNEKSMVLRVTDKNLIAKTGGIVQGMSGSPIIQDGKLIGAVTHVFVNDATKGFGIYIDWMLEQ
ncbi:MAG: SpoIVB peptidase [Firmicutes bacterium]|nr:SpoIVB peptidase [Bacillota bacterium]MDY5676955.1 SpoIVB peptidase [Eubacteriales bacterium]